MLDEFFLQGDLERSSGLAVSPMMDRGSTNLAISQINFIEFVVAPLYYQVCHSLSVLCKAALACSASLNPVSPKGRVAQNTDHGEKRLLPLAWIFTHVWKLCMGSGSVEEVYS